jgi:HD-like signal output (HDOD) protein
LCFHIFLLEGFLLSMPNTLAEWTQFLGERPLPVLIPSKQQVAQLLDSSNATNVDLERVIGRDPGFALGLFRRYAGASNSPKEPPGSLAHAVSLLGLSSVAGLLKQLPVVEETLDGPGRKGLGRCYSHALHAAHYASGWGREREDNNPEELGLAALLYNCGEMALWTHAGAEMEKIEAQVAAGASYAGSSRSVLGCTLRQLNSALAGLWQLPHLVSTALAAGWPAQPRAQKVVLATALARETERDWNSTETQDLTDILAELQRLSPDRTRASLHTLAVETARDIQELALPLTAPALISLCPIPEQPPEESPPPAIPEPLPEKRPAPDKPAPAQQPPAKPAAPKPTPSPANRLQQGLMQIADRMQKDIGVNRIMFAMLQSDRKTLKARFIAGREGSDGLNRFNCVHDKRNLFTVLLSKPQGFWLKEDNRDKYLPLIPEPLRDTVNTRGFFVMSIYVRNKPVGLMYADAEQPDTLDEEGYKRFKQLCQQLSNQLAGGK